MKYLASLVLILACYIFNECRADSDPPQWVRRIGYSFKISNAGQFPSYKFFALPDMDDSTGIVQVNEKEFQAFNFSKLIAFKVGSPVLLELEKSLKEPSDALLKKVDDSSIKIELPQFTARDFCPGDDLMHCSTFIADELSDVADEFQITSANDKTIVLKNKSVTLTLTDKKKIDLPYDKYDQKNPRAWMKSVGAFSFDSLKKFSEWGFLILRSAGDQARIAVERSVYNTTKGDVVAVYAVKRSLLPSYEESPELGYGSNFLQTLGYAAGYESGKSFWNSQAIYLGGFKVDSGEKSQSIIKVEASSGTPDHLTFESGSAEGENVARVDIAGTVADLESRAQVINDIAKQESSEHVESPDAAKAATLNESVAPVKGGKLYYIWFFALPTLALLGIVMFIMKKRKTTPPNA